MSTIDNSKIGQRWTRQFRYCILSVQCPITNNSVLNHTALSTVVVCGESQLHNTNNHFRIVVGYLLGNTNRVTEFTESNIENTTTSKTIVWDTVWLCAHSLPCFSWYNVTPHAYHCGVIGMALDRLKSQETHCLEKSVASHRSTSTDPLIRV